MLKVYAALAREFKQDPASIDRYPALKELKEGKRTQKTILAKGAEDPIDGERDVAAYFVRRIELYKGVKAFCFADLFGGP